MTDDWSDSRTSRARRIGLALVIAGLTMWGAVGVPGCKSSGGRKRANVAPGILFINEVVANADGSDPGSGAVLKDGAGNPILDANGDPVDWIEVYNVSSQTVKLRNVWLSNDPAVPRLYRFPKKFTLGPGEFVVVICDGRPRLGAFHAPFTLDAGGATVAMYSRKGKDTLDEKRWVQMPANVAAGHYPDGETEYGLIHVATPGEPNKPVNVLPPRIDGDAGVGPASTDVDDPTPLTVRVLEDFELLNATVEILQVDDCSATGGGEFDGPFPLQIVDELTEELTETRRDHLNEPIDIPVERLTLVTLLPHFDEGDTLRLRFRLENVMGVTSELQCQVVLGPEPALLDFDDTVFVDPRCPEPTEPATVQAFLRVDEANSLDPSALEVSLVYVAGTDAPVTIDRASGLVVEEADACAKACYRLEDVAGTRLLSVVGVIPAQPRGTLVTFTLAARDTVRDEDATLEPGDDTAHTSFRFLSGYEPPDIVFNEFMSANRSVLAGLYPAAIRNDPAFSAPDYAELYNFGSAAVDIGDMFLAEARDATCPDDGSACPPDLIFRVRDARVPAGTVIPPKGFHVVLFTTDAQLNTSPDLTGSPLEGKTTIVTNGITLDDCRETLFLISRDEEGNCPAARLDWDFRSDPGLPECLPGDVVLDTPFGHLPDGEGGVVVLDFPSPGEPNCAYEAPALVGGVSVAVVGPAQPSGCARPGENTLEFTLRVEIAVREVVLNPAGVGVASVAVTAGGESLGATFTATRILDPGTPRCAALVELVVSDVGFPSTVEDPQAYTITVTDTRGNSVDAPASAEVCLADGDDFIRGDANFDVKLDVTDLVWIVWRTFAIVKPTCPDAYDANDDGEVDLEDFFLLANWIYRRGPPPPEPFPEPGPDPTPDDLPCVVDGPGGP